MPIVTGQLAKGRDVDVMRRLAGEITNVLVENLDVNPEWVAVLFRELDRENWAAGGRLHIDRCGHGWGRQGAELGIYRSCQAPSAAW
jgi:4-oxalocrotonate tautomerase